VKRLLVMVVLGALTTGAAGCDLSPTAATVNGTSVSQSQFQGQLSVISGNAVAQCALSIEEAQSGGTLPAVTGSGDATVTTPFAAFELNTVVEQTLEQVALARRHVHVTAPDVDSARQDYLSQMEAASSQVASPCSLTGTALVDRLPKAFVDDQASALAVQERLEEVVGGIDVSPAALRAYYDAHRAEVTQVCLNLIVATSQASAQAIHDQIAAGASFATASGAAGVNPNSPTGGQGPCVYPAQIVAQLGQAAAAAVEPLADGALAPPQGIPIANQTTGTPSTVWIVIGVRQHHLVSFADSESGLRQQLLANGGARLTAVLSAEVRSARVTIDPRYGTWNERRGVITPTAPNPSFVLNPAVDGSSAGTSILGSGGQPAG